MLASGRKYSMDQATNHVADQVHCIVLREEGDEDEAAEQDQGPHERLLVAPSRTSLAVDKASDDNACNATIEKTCLPRGCQLVVLQAFVVVAEEMTRGIEAKLTRSAGYCV